MENESGSKIILENSRKPIYKNIMKTHMIWLWNVCPHLETGYWRAVTDTILSLDVL